ncbi:MAG: hypothetical protein AAFU73_17070 [Planctomycetota bacterium]
MRRFLAPTLLLVLAGPALLAWGRGEGWVGPWGDALAIGIQIVAICAVIGPALGLFLFALELAQNERYRARARVGLVLLGLAFGAQVGSVALQGVVRSIQQARAVERGDRVVAAIQRHVERTAQPPTSLEDLVPAEIAALPGTGYAPFPAFSYEVEERNDVGQRRWRLRAILLPSFVTSGRTFEICTGSLADEGDGVLSSAGGAWWCRWRE